MLFVLGEGGGVLETGYLQLLDPACPRHILAPPATQEETAQ